MKLTDEIEKLAEKLHIWYLEATKELSPESYNPDAQKEYKDLTEEQKFIDRYIAQAITKHIVENYELKAKKQPWMNARAYCWFCDKDIDCECMDATCWECGRPYAKDRCEEFGFDDNGYKRLKKG